MSASINKVILIGNLGKDPDVRHTPSGVVVVNMTLATSSSWKDKNSGEKVEETEWHRLTAYDRLAEICGEYLTKGSPIYVEGRLKTRKWQDKEGVDKYTTEIIVNEMKMLGSRAEREETSEPQRRPAAAKREGGREAQTDRRPAQPTRAPGKPGAPGNGGAFDDMDDDIPF